MESTYHHRVLSAVSVIVTVCIGCGLAPNLGVVHAQGLDALQRQQPSGCRVEVVESSLSRIVLDFWASTPQWDTVTGPDGQPYDQPSIPGCTLLTQPGQPRLPVQAELLGIPPEATFRISVLDAQVETLPGPFAVPPVEQPLLDRPMPGDAAEAVPQQVGSQWLADASIYEANAFYPDSAVVALEPGYARQQRVLPVHFYPLQSNPVTGEVRFHRYLRVALDLRLPLDRQVQLSYRPEAEGLEQALEQTLVNYETASTWRAPQAPVLDSTPWAPPQPGYKILVEEEGIHHLTFAQLQAAIPDPGLAQIDPATFQIFADGEEIAIYVASEDDQPLLTPRDILFYAHDIGDKYTAQKVYWFTYGQQPGLRMTTRDGTPVGASAPPAYQQDLHFEENLNYWPEMPPASTDLERYFGDWAARPPIGGIDAVIAHDVNLENVVTSGAYSATLEVSLLGYTTNSSVNPDHHTQVYVNNNPVGGVIAWDGVSRLTRSFLISQGDLQEGLNTIEVQLPGVAGQDWSDWQLLDWFNLGYYREHVAQNNRLSFNNDNDGQWEYRLEGFAADDIWLFDVTDPAQLVQVVSGTVEADANFDLRFEDTVSGEVRYEAANTSAFHTPLNIVADTPSDWGQPVHGADYIIITHANFLTQAGALKDQKESLGLRTVVIDVEDLYDEFNYGMLSPHAIRRFLAYAYVNWAPPAPAYVLLIGDGHYDYKDNEGYDKPNLVPPWMQYLPPDVIPGLVGEGPADNRYVTIVGTDAIPDMHIGRFPVSSAAEAEAMVAKTVNYAGAADGDWRKHLLMVADDPDPTAGRNFHQLSDELVTGYLDGAYNVERAYLGDPTTCPYQNPATVCNEKVINGISAGALLVNYVGHAYSTQWAYEGLFQVDDVADLATRSDWPIVLGMDCNDGYFANPNPIYEALAEVLTVADAKGSVANWSSAAFGFAASHQYLEHGFFQAVFLDGVRELGPATLAGKLVAYAEGAVDTLDSYHLFGDPALRLRALDADVHVTKSVEPTTTLAPGEWLTYTLTFGNHGPGTAHHVVVTDVLPIELVNAVVVYASPEVVNQNPGIEFAWAITDILSGTRGLIQLRAMVDPDLEPGIFFNEAHISMAEPDTDLGNNHALSWPTTVRSKVYLPIVLRAQP